MGWGGSSAPFYLSTDCRHYMDPNHIPNDPTWTTCLVHHYPSDCAHFSSDHFGANGLREGDTQRIHKTSVWGMKVR